MRYSSMMGLLLSGLALCSVACHPTPPTTNTFSTGEAARNAEAISLLGQPLFAPQLPDEVRQRRELELADAQSEYDLDPHAEQSIIWLGRRQAYLGRYRESIDTFSNGLALHPDSFKLLRHRGHRYITIRKFELARKDLTCAAELIQDVADEIEPDGQPNRLNIPTSTSHTNIYYHLGLAAYLQRDFSAAADAYERCLEHSKNDDMRIATLYWQYLTLMRLNRQDDARRCIEEVSQDVAVIENVSYLRLLLLFKGELAPDQILDASGQGDPSVDLATVQYGVGMWHLLHGNVAEARSSFEQVLDRTTWAAFGHIAAETELKELLEQPR